MENSHLKQNRGLRFEQLGLDVLMMIARQIRTQDRLRLGATNRYLYTLITQSPSLWRQFRLKITARKAGSDDHYRRKYHQSVARRELKPQLAALHRLLSHGKGTKQEIQLDLEFLSLEQIDKIVAAIRPYSALVHALSVDAYASDDVDTSFLELTRQMGNLRLLRIIDVPKDSESEWLTLGMMQEDTLNIPASLPEFLPHLKTFHFCTSKLFALRKDDSSVSFLYQLEEFDMGKIFFQEEPGPHPFPYLVHMDAIRQLLVRSKNFTRRAKFRLHVAYDGREPSAETVELPMLEELHIDCAERVHARDDLGGLPGLLSGLLLSGLKMLSLYGTGGCLSRLRHAAPNLRIVSFGPWSWVGDAHSLGRELAALVSLERLEFVGRDGYDQEAVESDDEDAPPTIRHGSSECSRFYQSFLHEAVSGLPSAEPLHLSPGHPVALPCLQELSLRLASPFDVDMLPGEYVRRDITLALPVLLRRGRVPFLSPCPSYGVSTNATPPIKVDLSTLPDLPAQYRTLQKLWVQNVTLKNFWNGVQSMTDAFMSEEEANQAWIDPKKGPLPLESNEQDAFWDTTQPKIPREESIAWNVPPEFAEDLEELEKVEF